MLSQAQLICKEHAHSHHYAGSDLLCWIWLVMLDQAGCAGSGWLCRIWLVVQDLASCADVICERVLALYPAKLIL